MKQIKLKKILIKKVIKMKSNNDDIFDDFYQIFIRIKKVIKMKSNNDNI